MFSSAQVDVGIVYNIPVNTVGYNVYESFLAEISLQLPFLEISREKILCYM